MTLTHITPRGKSALNIAILIKISLGSFFTQIVLRQDRQRERSLRVKFSGPFVRSPVSGVQKRAPNEAVAGVFTVNKIVCQPRCSVWLGITFRTQKTLDSGDNYHIFILLLWRARRTDNRP